MPRPLTALSIFSPSSFELTTSLQAAGLIAFPDIPPVTVRTALSGTASFSDALVLAPGMQQQQTVSENNCGEFPITGAMTTGYVFRVENPATVYYLQSIGVTSHLVTAHVYPYERKTLLRSFLVPATLLYALCQVLTLIVAVSLAHIQDWWGLGVLGGFVVSRLINVIIIKLRDERGWKGQKEPGVQGDLFILLCHDRWVRLQGSVDDLKVVTSGLWLRDLTAMESKFTITCAMRDDVGLCICGSCLQRLAGREPPHRVLASVYGRALDSMQLVDWVSTYMR